MKIWYQNLDDGAIKKYWKYFRATIGIFSIEVSVPTCHLHIHFGINSGDGNNQLAFSFACKLFAIWLHVPFYQFRVGHWSKWKDIPRFFVHEEREFNLSWHDGAIWLMLWGDSMGGWSRDMAWHLVTHSFHPIDFLLGRAKFSDRLISSGDCVIPMPEGCYNATYELKVACWKRPRWPFRTERQQISINIPKGIPHEGKGENSWDCGEDGLFGIHTNARDLEEGIAAAVASCLRSRRKYGRKYLHRDQKMVMARS